MEVYNEYLRKLPQLLVQLETVEKMKQYLDPAVVSLYDAWRQINSNISE